MNNIVLSLKKHTDCLLSDSSTWLERRESVHEIAALFGSIDAFNLQKENPNNNNEQWLTNGCAIGSWGAAMCLLEVSRTRMFLQGIIDALKDLLEQKKERPLQILDAGCGPYALLSLLPALYFSKEEVRFNLLDVIPENIQFAKELFNKLDLEDYLGNTYIDDATKFIWSSETPLDMVISETMLNGLRKEPQVAITLQLVKQLGVTGILIPEQVTVTLERMNINNQIDQTSLKTYSSLGTLIKLNKAFSADTLEETFLTTIQLPSDYNNQLEQLEYHTHICVYKQYTLNYNDCSLTIPIVVSAPHKNPLQKDTLLQFSYQLQNNPGIQLQVIQAAYA